MNHEVRQPKLTPSIGCFLTSAALVFGLTAAAGVAWWMMDRPLEHVESPLWRERYESNWIPQSDQIVRIRAQVKELVDGEEQVKVIRLPLESAVVILDCLARRTEWKQPPRPKGVMVHYDFKAEFVIEFDVDDMTRPISLSFTRWGGVWVGDDLFVVPQEDFRKLQNLVYGYSTGHKIPVEAADATPIDG